MTHIPIQRLIILMELSRFFNKNVLNERSWSLFLHLGMIIFLPCFIQCSYTLDSSVVIYFKWRTYSLLKLFLKRLFICHNLMKMFDTFFMKRWNTLLAVLVAEEPTYLLRDTITLMIKYNPKICNTEEEWVDKI